MPAQVGGGEGSAWGPGGPDSTVVDQTFGFRCWSGVPTAMPRAHRHDDIEVNVARGAELVYLFGGRAVRIGPGQIAAFWAAMPHQLVACTPGATVAWLTVPLAMFLGWPFPGAARAALLQVRPLVSGASAPADAAADTDAFARWARDLADGSTERHEIAALEIQACLRRLALAADDPKPALAAAADGSGQAGRELAHAATMAGFVARHYADPIEAADIAAAAHLHPHYAMAVFRRAVGTTLGRYLSQCRVAQAQRLLVGSDLPVTAVAQAAGFTSASRFYAVFAQTCGVSPGNYRRAARAVGWPAATGS